MADVVKPVRSSTNGNMATLTLGYFSTWSYGDNYFFIDYLSGNSLDFAGSPSASQSITPV